jgi:hypothetical protein
VGSSDEQASTQTCSPSVGMNGALANMHNSVQGIHVLRACCLNCVTSCAILEQLLGPHITEETNASHHSGEPLKHYPYGPTMNSCSMPLLVTVCTCRSVQVHYRRGSTAQQGLLGQALAVNKEKRKTLSQIAHIDVLYSVAWPLSIVITDVHILRCRRLLSVFLQVHFMHAIISSTLQHMHVYRMRTCMWHGKQLDQVGVSLLEWVASTVYSGNFWT